MDKAKGAIKDFMSKAGHHDTTVHETVAPGVQHETVKPHQHEEVNTAIDKEVHQDHYHRTVQPVHDREVLPEQHTAKLGAVQHREFDNRDHEGTKRALVEEQGGFRDHQTVQDTTHSQSVAPTVGGEHVHHHIHETIQPVVHKETVQPNVVHTTVPIHETHHNAAKHHATSQLPAVSMGEFKQKGGVLGGREERYDGFEGEPKNIGGAISGLTHGHGHGHSKHDSHHNDPSMKTSALHGDHAPLDSKAERHTEGLAGTEGTTRTNAGLSGGNIRGVEDSRDMSGMERGIGGGNTTRSGNDHVSQAQKSDFVRGAGEPGLAEGREIDQASGGGFGRGLEGQGHNTGNTATKPSLMNKLNPMKDSDGDGRKGFME